LWYYLIIKVEDPISFNEVKRGILLLVNYRQIIVKSCFGLIDWDNNKKMYDLRIEVNKRLSVLFPGILIALTIFFVLPFFNAILITSSDNAFIGIIFYGAFLSAFIGKLISTRRLCMFYLKRVKQIIDFIDAEPDLIDGNYSEIHVQHLMSKILIAVIFAVALTGMFIFLQQLLHQHQDNIYVEILIGLLFFIAFMLNPLVEKYRKQKLYAKSEKLISIQDNIYLNKFTDEIKRMCEDLKITDLYVEMSVEINIDNAFALVTKYTRPKLQITQGLFESIADRYSHDFTKYYDLIKFVIGHELIHIQYKDQISNIKRQKIAAACNLAIYIAVMLIAFAAIKFNLFLFLLDVIPFLYMVLFGKTISDIRYWEQMSELRADRYGLKISGVSLEQFITFWTFPERVNQENRQRQFIDRSNFVYKYIKRYVENEAHPSLERRISAMKRRYQKWGMIDYIQQLFAILYWRFVVRRGWNGR
jgi:Zn-dependent protease with chaperone function